MPTRVTVLGLKEFTRELKRMERSLGKEMRQIHLKVSRLVSGRATGAAPPTSGRPSSPGPPRRWQSSA